MLGQSNLRSGNLPSFGIALVYFNTSRPGLMWVEKSTDIYLSLRLAKLDPQIASHTYPTLQLPFRCPGSDAMHSECFACVGPYRTHLTALIRKLDHGIRVDIGLLRPRAM